MPRILPPTPETTPEETRPLLEALKKNLGMAPNLFTTIGHSPEALSALLSAMQTLSKGKLSAREVEAINLYASELNGCSYCVSAHSGLARLANVSSDDITLLREGRGGNAREQAILNLVRRVVRTGGVGAGRELALAREAGLTDREVMEVLMHVALKAFTNAVALVAQTDIDFPRAPRLPEL